MKNGLIFSLGAAAGAVVGSGITFIVVSRIHNRKKDDETEEVRAYYRKKCSNCEYKKAQISKNVEIKAAEKQIETIENDDLSAHSQQTSDVKLSQKVGLAERNTADIGRKSITPSTTDYTKFAKMAGNYATGSTKDLFTYPHEIDEVEYDKNEDYDKIILTYYETDDILADINDRISDFTVEDFGYNNMNDFGFDGVKYLRNEKTKTDFKILYNGDMSYDEATGGVNLNDP